MTTADFVYSVGADTTALEKSIKDASKKSEAAFGRVGNAIEKKTAGLRKFQGALSSTVGIATGMVGVFGAVAGAAAGLYAMYDRIVGAADRVTEANRKSNLQTERAIALAREKIAAEQNFLDILKSQNKESIETRLQALREERDRIDSNVGPGRQFMVGAAIAGQTVLGAFEDAWNLWASGRVGARQIWGEEDWDVDPQATRYVSLLEEIGKLETELGNISRGTEQKAGRDIADELQKQEMSLERQAEIQRLRASGLDAEALVLERRAAHEADVAADQKRYLELVEAGLNAEATHLQRIIGLKREIFEENEQALRQGREIADQAKKSADHIAARDLKRSLQERTYRAAGRDDLADQIRHEDELTRIRERINALDISNTERDALLGQVDQWTQFVSGAGGRAELGPGRVQFGASAEGHIGAAAAAQVIGGGVDVNRQLAKARNTTLNSMDDRLGELVQIAREPRMAVFG